MMRWRRSVGIVLELALVGVLAAGIVTLTLADAGPGARAAGAHRTPAP
jgi:hypothetical protein